MNSIHLILLSVVFVCSFASATSIVGGEVAQSDPYTTDDEITVNGKVYVLKERCSVYEDAGSGSGDDRPKVGSAQWYMSLSIVIGCVVMAALAAGLTLSIGSIDGLRLDVIIKASEYYNQHEDEATDEEAEELLLLSKYAKKLSPLINGPDKHSWWWSHHLLLVTLLLVNSAANEVLPLFLDKLVPSWMAIIFSVSIVLFFGEIIPSALFTSAKMPMAAAMAPVMYVILFVCYPIACPIAKVLDALLKHDEEPYKKEELRALIAMHGEKTNVSNFKAKIFLTPTDPSPSEAEAHTEIPINEEEEEEQKRLLQMDEGGTPAEAVCSRATAKDFEDWLLKLNAIPRTDWQVELEPRSSERRGQGTDTTWLMIKTQEAANTLTAAINKQGKGGILLRRWIPMTATEIKPDTVDNRFSCLERHEVELINAVLDLDTKPAGKECQSIQKTAMVPSNKVLDKETLKYLSECGFSRVPIHPVNTITLTRDEGVGFGLMVNSHLYIKDFSEKVLQQTEGILHRNNSRVTHVDGVAVHSLEGWQNAIRGKDTIQIQIAECGLITGLLLLRSLIGIENSDNGGPIASEIACPSHMIAVSPATKLHKVLELFQKSQKHFAVVTSNPELYMACWQSGDFNKLRINNVATFGILTLEDVLEELVGDINDEMDSRRENQHRRHILSAHHPKSGFKMSSRSRSAGVPIRSSIRSHRVDRRSYQPRSLNA